MASAAQRRWLGPVIGLVAFLVTLVGGVALGGAADVAIRQAEMAQLLTRVENSEGQMVEVQEALEQVTADFEALPNPTDEDRAALVGDLADVAAYGREAIGEAGVGVAGDEYLPWHGAIRRAQQDYLAHNQAWQDYLERAAVDPAELTKPQDEINTSFEQAEVSMRAAVPPLSDEALRSRVEIIFAEPQDSSGGQAA